MRKRMGILSISVIVILILVTPSFSMRLLIQSSLDHEITTQHQLGPLPTNLVYGEDSIQRKNAKYIFRPYEIYQAFWEEGIHYVFLDYRYQSELLFFYDFSQGGVIYYTKLEIPQPKARLFDTLSVGHYKTNSSKLEDGVLTTQRILEIDPGLIVLVNLISLIFGFFIGFYLYYRMDR